MSFAVAGPVALCSIHVSPTAFFRKRTHVDTSDDFFFNPMTAGWHILTVKGQATRYDVGEGCLLHMGAVADGHLPEGGSALGIRIEGSALRALVRRPEELVGRPIRRNNPGMPLLMGYLRSFAEAGESPTPQLIQNFGHHVVDVVASMCGTSPEEREHAAGGVRAARLQKIMDSIASHACDPHFSVEFVAAELFVTSRTIQLILEETGSTFSEHVGEHRLRRAWRLLADANSDLSIAEVAYEAGFNDLSHFYRAFRRRYGETPASVRAGSQRVH